MDSAPAFEDTARTPDLRDGLPEGMIPALFSPRFVPAAQVRIQPDAFVFGYAHDGDAHAYALNLLDHHEVVNDTVGGRPITATW